MNRVQTSKSKRRRPTLKSSSSSKCRQCGGVFPHTNKPCPAAGQTCHRCGKLNHFSKYCLSKIPASSKFTHKGKQKKVQILKETKSFSLDTSSSETDSDDSYLYAITAEKKTKPQTSVNVQILGHKFPIMIDTRANINVIDQVTFKKMRNVHLKPTRTKVYTYDSEKPIKILGMFEATIETKKRITVANFYVTPGNPGCLLNAETAQADLISCLSSEIIS